MSETDDTLLDDADPAGALAHIQIREVEHLMVSVERLLAGAKYALESAAVRRDVHGSAITALRARQAQHTTAINELKRSEKTLLDDLNERRKP